MRIGCCLNMVASGPDGTGLERIGQLSAFGYDYAELPLAEMMTLGVAEFKALKSGVEGSGVRCEACNNFFPKMMRLTGPAVDRGAVLAYAERALGRAAELGAVCVVFGSGGAKQVPDGFPMEDGYRQVVDLLRGVAPIAKRNGITIAIEPLRKRECNLINRFEEGCQLAREVGSETVRVLVDYYHLSQEREPVENIERYGREFLRHVHFARNEGRAYPRQIGEDGYAPFFNALRAVGYDARISVEAFSGDFAEDAPLSLRLLREQFQNKEDAI